MSRRASPAAAFVDESIRGQRYLLACVVVEARHLTDVRQAVSELAPAGKRIHFYEGSDRTRRGAIEVFTSLPIRVWVTVCPRVHGVSEFLARDASLSEIVRRLQREAVAHLTVESRQFDLDDERTIIRARAKSPSLVFDHVVGVREPVLWIADGVAWAFGAGGRWAGLVEPMISEVIEIRP